MLLDKNIMTRDQCKMAFPKSGWFQPAQGTKAEMPEAALQSYANDALALRRWGYIRFPDGFLRWMKLHTPSWIQAIFFEQCGGRLPDNLILISLGSGFFLGAKLELKTQDKKGRAVGRTRGKQKKCAEKEEWFIARSPEQIELSLKKISEILDKIRQSKLIISEKY
jgi:hypothetical protein